MSNPRRLTKKSKDLDETIDIDTFKAWLSGVEDMQGDDWTPSAEQWKKIRAKINLLSVPEYEDPKPAFPPNYQAPRYPGYAPIAPPVTSVPLMNPPDAFAGPAVRPNLGMQGPQLGNSGALPGFSAPGAGSGSSNSLLSVPNDLGDQPYESSFS